MRPEDAFAHRGVARRPLPRRSLRLWSVRHAFVLAAVYRSFERALRALHPLFARIGYSRLERPVASVERTVKQALFDCRMCGQCVLSATGLSCPMNCPKGLRNGPCGGVRANGNCEVHPDMPCVWVQAYAGAERMGAGATLGQVQAPVDHRRAGTSSWLEAARKHAAS
jgi:Methylene-tetrahydrofolate reductase C terminal